MDLEGFESHFERPNAGRKTVEICLYRGDIGDPERLLQRDMRRHLRATKPSLVVMVEFESQFVHIVMKRVVEQQGETGFHHGTLSDRSMARILYHRFYLFVDRLARAPARCAENAWRVASR